MTEPNKSVFARPYSSSTVSAHPSQTGITVREYFSAKAMQGLLSTPTLDPNETAEDVAQLAVRLADALIGALNK